VEIELQKNYLLVPVKISILSLLVFLAFFPFSNSGFSQSYRDFELDQIKFDGNNSFSEGDLRSILASKESPMWFWKFLNSFTSFGKEPEYFDSSKVRIDKLSIESFYHANGFFLVKTDHRLEVDSSSRTVSLIYLIDEGRSANYGKLHFGGFSSMPDFVYHDMVSKAVTIDSSKRYSQDEVQSNINKMIKYLADNGYLFGDYDSTIVIMDTIANRTDIELYFTLNDRYSISDITVKKSGVGADDVSFELIEEISSIRSNQIYSQEQIDRGQFRLFRTGLFSSLEIDPNISEAKDGLVPVIINARVGTMNEISPEIIADNQNNSFNSGIGVDFIRKNFLGDARKLTISLSSRIIDLPNFNFSNIFKSADERDDTYQGDIEVLVKLEQPFLFGRPILTTTEVYYRGLTIAALSGIEFGSSQKFDFEMPQYTFITLLRPTVSIDFINYTINVSEQNSDRLLVDIKSTTPGLGVELGSTKTDDLFFPVEGYSLLLNPEIAQSRTNITLSGPEIQSLAGVNEIKETETAYFYRIQASVAKYLSLSKDKTSVLATKFKTGYIQTISGGYDLVPPNKTFFAGGSNSVRGWRARELVPEDKVDYYGITPENQPRGGTFLLEGSLEIRQKLAESFGFALFTDYGNTWNSYKNLTFDEFAVAAGLGLRVYTPIAPFRLDFGVKFYDPEDRKMIFGKKLLSNLEIHFGIGEAF
jgi:outer membrane protein assembly factor BamA